MILFCDRPMVKLLIGPLQIFFGYLDLIKDSILLSKLVTALGGFYIISINFTKFSSVVSFVIKENIASYTNIFFFLGCNPANGINNHPYNLRWLTLIYIWSISYIQKKILLYKIWKNIFASINIFISTILFYHIISNAISS